jgi:hypothetical protein
MLRVCGAETERDALSRSQCWCRGLFCGRGGFKASKDFRKAFRTKVPAYSRSQLDELMRQADLFTADESRALWVTRLERFVKPRD